MGEFVDVHAAREVGLDIGEAVGQGEGELGDGVRAGLGDVVSGDRHRVEVAHVAVAEGLLDVGHHLQGELGGEDAGVLGLVFLEDVGLDGAAGDLDGGVEDLLPLAIFEVRADRHQAVPVLAVDRWLEGGLGWGVEAARLDEPLARLLAGGGVEKHRQHHRRRAVDGHGDRGGGVAQIESGIESFDVLDGADGDPGLADFAPDVAAWSSGSSPYRVTESKAVDRRVAGSWPSAKR